MNTASVSAIVALAAILSMLPPPHSNQLAETA